MRSNLSRRDFNKLTSAAFGGMVAGTMFGCSSEKNEKNAGGGHAGAVVAVAAGIHACRGLNDCKGRRGRQAECLRRPGLMRRGEARLRHAKRLQTPRGLRRGARLQRLQNQRRLRRADERRHVGKGAGAIRAADEKRRQSNSAPRRPRRQVDFTSVGCGRSRGQSGESITIHLLVPTRSAGARSSCAARRSRRRRADDSRLHLGAGRRTTLELRAPPAAGGCINRWPSSQKRIGRLRFQIDRSPRADCRNAVGDRKGSRRRQRLLEPPLRAADPPARCPSGNTLQAAGIQGANISTASLLFDPDEVQAAAGGPFQVFTPFWKACLDRPEPPERLPAPARLPAPPRGLPVSSLPNCSSSRRSTGPPACARLGRRGWRAHQKRLKHFAQHELRGYASGAIGRSRRQLRGFRPICILAKSARGACGTKSRKRPAGRRAGRCPWRPSPFLRQLGWREFAHYLLYHFPHTESRLRCGLSSPNFPGATIRNRYAPGSAAKPAIRWSTPACGNCGPPAGCTTACGWWWDRSW